MSKIVKTKYYAETILRKLRAQYKNEELCDVHILAGTEKVKIPAHRNILSVASDYFRGMFSTTWSESTSREVEIPNLNAGPLQCIMEYMYTGYMEINEDNVEDLVKVADMLLMDEVITYCEEFLLERLNITNCIELTLLADQYHCQNLLKVAKRYCLDHLMDISETVEYLNLNAQQLSGLLLSDNLCTWTDDIIFTNLMKWIEHEPTEREKFRTELLKLVRLPLLDDEKLKPACNSVECSAIHMEALELKSLPDCNTKSRTLPTTYLMALTESFQRNEMYIQYYCPQRSTWLRSMLHMEYRYRFAVAILNDKLFIVGGRDKRGAWLRTAVCLNLTTMIATDLSPMKVQRVECYAVVLKGFLYAVNGQGNCSIEKWNPETDEWSEIADMTIRRTSCGVGVFNDKLYAFGGVCGHSSLCSAECYDPERNEWQSIASMKKSRILPGVVVANGVLYVVGGLGEQTVERYDPQIDNWTTVCSLSFRIYNQSCASLRNKVVVCYKDRIEEYDAERNEWIATKFLNSEDEISPIFSYAGKDIRTYRKLFELMFK